MAVSQKVDIKKLLPLPEVFLKPKGFCPNPVVKHGVPSFADSILNPKVVGTERWKQYWDEQLYYILNGYWTKGIFIPGRYYYYLNFCKTASVSGGGSFYPEYVDSQYEFFLTVEQAKEIDYSRGGAKNIIIPKGRRKGVSIMAVSIVDYGYRFLHNYHAGIAAGKKEHSEEFLEKWEFLNSLMVPELRTRTLQKNNSEIISGWVEQDTSGMWGDKGTRNIIYCRTMFTDPGVFKGKYLNDVIYEECGEFDNLIETAQATKKCMMDGDIQVGTSFFYGTGGKIATGSKGFQIIWHNQDKYNCVPFFFDGTRYLKPFVAGSTQGGKSIENIPNLLKYLPYQRVGMEDRIAARAAIDKKKAELLKLSDRRDYWEECKDNPVEILDVFRKAASNDFDIEILNAQQFEILSNDPRYGKYILEYKTNAEGIPVTPLEVYARPAKSTDEEKECWLILHEGHPVKNFRNLHVGGVDSYDQDKSMHSASLGSMVVLRKNNNSNTDVKQKTPVLLIRCRPSRKEKFYEMCLKASIYYDLKGNTLIDHGKPGIIKYYKDGGGEMYLAKQPAKFQSENSDLKHEYGVSINSYSKPLMIGLLQTFYLDYGKNVWFPVMIDEALSYDEAAKSTESDCDSVDALGIALMQLEADTIGVINDNEIGKEDPYAYPIWETDAKGNIISQAMKVWRDPVSKDVLLKHGIDLKERQMEMMLLHEDLNEADNFDESF